MSKKQKNLQWAWLISLLLTPIVLWILPANYFDEGQAICLSMVLFDIECFSCGMTRAVMHMHHLEFEDAIFYNYGIVVVYPVLVILWAIWLYNAACRLGLVKAKKQNNAVA